MDDRVIFVIQEYIDRLVEPSESLPRFEFRKNSYSKWAALEIFKFILENPNVPPINVVTNFARKMKEYSAMDHHDHNQNFIFYIAHDVATDILDILRAMN